MTKRLITLLGALSLAGCSGGVSLRPGQTPHSDGSTEVLAVTSTDASTDLTADRVGGDADSNSGADVARVDASADDAPHGDAGADLGQEVVADAAQDFAEEVGRDAAPDLGRDMAPDAAPDVAPEDTGPPPVPIIVEFPIPTADSFPMGIAAGSDGNIWFTEEAANQIGRITPNGTITEFPIPTAGSGAMRICSGPDHDLWFTETFGHKIGRITEDGQITEFDVSPSLPDGITTGPDGNIWFVIGPKIGHMTPQGQSEIEISSVADARIAEIVSSPADGNLWASDLNGLLHRITPSGVITDFSPTTANTATLGLAADPVTGRLWFTESDVNQVGTMDPLAAGSGPTAPMSEFRIPTPNGVLGMASDSDGGAWFTQNMANRVGHVTGTGVFTEFVLPTPDSNPLNIVADSAGNVWFVESTSNQIGRLSFGR